MVKLTSVTGKLYGFDTAAATNLSAEIVGSATVGFLSTEAVGSTSVAITDATHLSATAVDHYAGGYLFMSNGTGEGYAYKIKSNTVAASNKVIFELYDGLVVQPDATSDCFLMANPWGDLLLCDANADNNVTSFAGVSQGAGTVTSTAYIYQWFQTWGPCVVLAGAATKEGEPLMHDDSGSYDGGVLIWDVITDLSGGYLGVGIAPATAAGDYAPTFLTIMP